MLPDVAESLREPAVLLDEQVTASAPSLKTRSVSKWASSCVRDACSVRPRRATSPMGQVRRGCPGFATGRVFRLIAIQGVVAV